MEYFVETQLSLLVLEREEELSEGLSYLTNGLKNIRELEEKGHCISRLEVESQRVGLFGRTIISFQRRNKQKLPVSSIGLGDILGLFANGRSVHADKLVSGVVTKSTDSVLAVAFEEVPETVNLTSFNDSLQLVKLANDVTYRRLKRVLEVLPSCLSERCGQLINVLFDNKPPGPPNPKWNYSRRYPQEQSTPSSLSLEEEADSLSFCNPMLDHSQKKAVWFALSRPDVAIIHGPPGTGKTTTVIEFIIQCTRLNHKVLACAPSNIAVDNLVERLAASRVKVVRLGHPARLVSSVLPHSLDSLLDRYDGSDVVKDIRKELNEAMLHISSSKTLADRRKLRDEVKTLKKELLQREAKILIEVLRKADVILATNTGASFDGPLKHLPKDHFDVVVIDECAQALEASCWIPLLHAPKCVLAGDHKQLPPTILSKEASRKGLSVTLMERLVELYGDQITTMLTVQYRMHYHIMEWPSQFLYGGVLTAHQSVASHLLRDLTGVADTLLTSTPIFFIDTAGCGLYELETGSEESKGNKGEAELVVFQIKDLLQSGVPPHEISVIAPYNLQVDLVRQYLTDASLSPKIEVHTVDGFQGREKEAVIITFTRSNQKGDIGFLREQRRTNVAVTRARRHLSIIGDSVTISHDPFIKGLIEYCSEHGGVHSAHEYIHIDSSADPETDHIGTDHTSAPEPPSHMLEKGSQDNTGPRSYTEQSKLYEQQLASFVNSKEMDSIEYSSLTSAQRKALYEAAELLGLAHESHGEGKGRVVTIRKNTSPSSTLVSSHCDPTQTKDTNVFQNHSIVPESPEESDLVDSNGLQSIDKGVKNQSTKQTDLVHSSEPSASSANRNSDDLSSTSGMWKCGLCGYVIPETSRELHELRCVREKRKAEEHQKAKDLKKKMEKSRTREIDRQVGRKKSKNSGKKGPGKVSDASEEDLDALISEIKLSDSTCRYPGCKKSVNLLGMRCQFCSNKYCMSHNIPELHGCGLEAKRHAREMMREAQSRAGREHGGKGLDATKRAHLQRKLDSKIEEMSSDRQRKKKAPQK